MVLTFPLMVAIQEISARVGRTTGKGIASNIREHYPAWLVQVLVAMLFGANVINIGADLSAMGDAGIVCVVGPTFLDYKSYVQVLKWSCLSLFFYVAALATVKVPWGEALKGWSCRPLRGTMFPGYFVSGRPRLCRRAAHVWPKVWNVAFSALFAVCLTGGVTNIEVLGDGRQNESVQ